MGEKGPIPKRSGQLIRRNAQETPVDKIDMIGPVEVPDLDIKNPHPLVVDLYESLKNSGQSKYYEPSDWQYARLTMHLVNDMLKPRRKRVKGKDGKYTYESPRISSMMLTAVNQMMTSLLLTEGDRRRVRIEVERNKNEAETGKVLDVADRFRQMLTNQPEQGSPGSG